MDAVHNRTSILNIALPILTALLLLPAPGHATSSPSFLVDTTSVSLVGFEGGNVNVSSSDGSTIQFQAIAAYNGETPWISINGNLASFTTVGGLATSTRVGFQAARVPTNTTATVTLHATSPASGVSDISITVNYSAQTGGCTVNCGGGSAYITANPYSVTTDNSSGPSPQTTVTLTTSSATSIPFTLATASPASWLTVSTSSTAVDVNDNATLTLQFSSTGLTAGQYNTTITINYASGPTTISVSFTVIASTIVTLNPASATWSGSVQSTTVQVSAGTLTINIVVNPSNPWIVLSWPNAPSGYPPASALYAVSTSYGFIALLNTSVAAPAVGTQGTVTVTDANQHSSVFTVTYNGTNGGGGGSGVVTVTPNPAVMSSALNGGCCVQVTVTVNSTVTGSMSAGLSNVSCSACFTLSTPSSINGGVAASVVVTGNPNGLATGTYYGTLTVSVTSNGTTNQGTTQLELVVGGGSTGTGGAVVAPTSLTFNVDINHPGTLGPQNVTIADPGNYTVTVSNGSQYVSLSAASGTSGGTAAPTLLQVSVVNPGNLSPGNYTGTISIQSSSGTTPVSFALNVYNSAVIYAATNGLGGPGTVNVTENAGNLGYVPQLYIFASDQSAMNFQASITSTGTWLQLNSISGTTSNSQPAPLALAFNAANLANGVYTGLVSITTATAPDSPLTVPVVLSVGGSQVSSGISLSQSSITLYGTTNGYTTSGQLGVTATTTTSFTATASSIGNWLSVTSSGTASTATSYLTVTANPSGLAAGTYYGTVTVSGGGSQPQVQVTFVVSASGGGGGGNVSSDQPSLAFTYQISGALPASKSLVISNQVPGTLGIPFTVTTAVNGNVPNWLVANVNGQSGITSGQTQATVVVSVIPGSLAAGPYSGTVNITPTGGNVLSIPVSMTVQGVATVTATPFQLPYTYQLGGTLPPSQAVQVSGSATGLPYSVQVSTTSGGNWLSVNKASGTTPDVLSVSVSPSSLTAGTSYTGRITVQGTGAAANSAPSNIAVTLTVTAPFPSITSVQNAASLSYGPTQIMPPVSPGELVTLFGTGLGPTSPLQTAIDPTTGKVATTLGNVQVLFNGYPAPLTYVSATQINCVVPYEVAQLTGPYVEVKYSNQTSNTYNLTQAATAPGIFTTNSGRGQGAILNGDSTYNGTGAGFTPAPAGSTIQVYMTGEGQTSPAGVTGKVNCPSGSACSITQLPLPLLRVAALVNNQPAMIAWFGEAPGIVSGVMQVNVVIPPNTPSGPASLVITVGSVSSQPGVTVAVQ